MKIKKTFYRRNLPHIQHVGGTFFVTFLLHGAMPKERVNRLLQEYQILNASSADKNLSQEYPFNLDNFDKKLNSLNNSPHWLKKEEIAQTVAIACIFGITKESNSSAIVLCIPCRV